ncbi:TPA: twin-arginine translocase TatA/TatE family subunit [Patescibacteria group bacterium]|uniref:Sec-independent protein translocase protein TatA n=1 Tax=Candidatus Gottesmanbacteria bacterium GW2011_GWA1_43_11 TaxID=1618436 RepID=A0A0G1CES2_9BACT|nr:MAG: Sec-independent protein translocase protein TatA [Candidatus Gottesmanbacteria bacterium GW2011_GWA1_43_11]HCS79138.1 twin-arginine translocase TatA/TatE family subunit [Patescibacteria group bacterium]
MFRNIGPTELIIIAAVILVIFGGKKLPEFAKGLGEAIKELRKAVKSGEEK